jgi:hypothetical protein
LTIGLGVSRFGLLACRSIAIFASDPLITDLGHGGLCAMKGLLAYLAFLAALFAILYISLSFIDPEAARTSAVEKEREAAIDMATKRCHERELKFVREMQRQRITIRIEHNKWHVPCPELDVALAQ